MNFKKVSGICLALAMTMLAGCTPEQEDPCKDVTCPEGQVCNSVGACVDDVGPQTGTKCPNGQTECGTDGCVNLKTNKFNCGTCGNACPSGQLCSDGSCVANCAAGEENCNGSCVDLKSDLENCGACGTACKSGEICLLGACTSSCPTGTSDCSGVCADLQNDRYNCGKCGTVCDEGLGCVDGSCKVKCAEGQSVCGDSCADLKNDRTNCGTCGNACDENKSCVDGSCKVVCPDGMKECNGACADTNTSQTNCGSCGNACNDNQRCSNGSCVISCPTTQEVCGNDCANLKNDRDNCGTCGNKCEGAADCIDGVCVSRCAGDSELCGNVCADLQSDPEHCGSCDNKCSGASKCSDGACVSTCKEGQVDCGGNCVNPTNSPDFCGAKGLCDGSDEDNTKGSICRKGQECSDGACLCKNDPNKDDPNTRQIACLVSENNWVCKDSKNDVAFCGCNDTSAGTDCLALSNVDDANCEMGECKILCKDGFEDCDGDPSNGCEVELGTESNCGGCGNACSSENATEASCIAGECVPVCKDGFVNCDGVCSDMNADTSCGACGNVCAEGSKCKDNWCVLDQLQCDLDGYFTYKIEDKEYRAYCIKNVGELKTVRDWWNSKGTPYPDAHNEDNAYILVKDLNLDEFAESTDATFMSSWTPIGTSGKPFTGVFIGNSHKVIGTMDCNQSTGCGLFGYVQGKIEDDHQVGGILDGFNLAINVKKDKWSRNNVGALVGNATQAIISRSYSVGKVEGHQNIGGLVGYAKDTIIKKSTTAGEVVSNYHAVGGLVGRMEGSVDGKSFIDYCNATGSVSANLNYDTNADVPAGGLAGYLSRVTVTNSSAKGEVSGHSNVGGFVGYATLSNITKCTADGAVHSIAFPSNTTINIGSVGGFIGQSQQGLIKNCIASGDVNANLAQHVGGFVGYSGASSQYERDVAKGDVKCATRTGQNSNAGGFAGYADGGSFVDCESQSSFVTGNSYIGGFVGYSTSMTMTNCSTAADVSANTSDSALYQCAGGFAGYVYTSNLKNCDAEGKVESDYYVGGHTGYAANNSSFTDCEAYGDVVARNKTVDVNNHGAGGFAGRAEGTRFERSYAKGNVKGIVNLGGFVGRSSGMTRLTQCAAFGSTSSISDTAAQNCGGLIGQNYDSSLTIDLSQSMGDTDCVNGGGVVGYLRSGQTQIADTYITGSNLYEGDSASNGSLIGMNNNQTISLNGVYWWEKAAENPSNASPSGAGKITGVKDAKFSYNDKNEAIYMDSQLSDVLNASSQNWSSAKCKLITGPANETNDGEGDYVVPVLKALSFSACQ